MKVTAENFGRLIRETVAAEVRRQLPGLVKECLTESFLRKLVSEQVAPHRSNLEQSFGQERDDEVTPVAMENDDEGIYQPSSLPIKSEIRKHVRSKLMENNPLGWLYEGVAPIKQSGEYSQPVSPSEMHAPGGVDLSQFGGLDPNRLKNAAGLTKKKLDVAGDDDPQMKRIREMRKRLDSETV